MNLFLHYIRLRGKQEKAYTGPHNVLIQFVLLEKPSLTQKMRIKTLKLVALILKKRKRKKKLDESYIRVNYGDSLRKQK